MEMNNQHVTRKVQSNMTGTLFISLPKKFSEIHNLKKGDQVLMELLEDQTLHLIPLTTFKVKTTTEIVRANP